MFNLTKIVTDAITNFFASLFDNLITAFATTLADVMASAMNVLQIPLVQNGIKYSQALAFTLLVIKGLNDTINTYILHKNGDPDADPKGLVIGIAQAVAVIATLPFIVTQMFTFGSKVAHDVAGLSSGQAGMTDWAVLSTLIGTSVAGFGGIVIIILIIAIVVLFLVVAFQATIRGAELALMSIIGPILALNLSSSNANVWSAWFKQLIIICTSQALQIFMIQGALALLTSGIASNAGLLMVFGWLWVAVKTPKFIQQFAYSTGFTGTVGSGAKQAGSMYMMRKMMTRV